MSEGTVEELQEKVHQLEENLRKVKSVDELTGLYMLLFALMSRNSNLSMTDSVLSKVTDFLAI